MDGRMLTENMLAPHARSPHNRAGSDVQARPAPIRPFYVSAAQGQVRVWQVGEGAPSVVLPGLINGAPSIARRLAAADPPVSAVVIELPGLGGSAGVAPTGLAAVTAAIRAAIEALGLTQAAVLALDLCAPLTTGLTKPIVLHGAAARHWARLSPPSSAPLPDGTHLMALFAFLRDRHVLDPAEPWRAATDGDPLPDAEALDEALLPAAVRPGAFAALWTACAAGMADLPAHLSASSWDDALRRLRLAPAGRDLITPPPPADGFRLGYADTPGGRMHLRRAGPAGQRPLIALHSAPGSAAPLGYLIDALAAGRDVIAPDYLGNGESDKPAGGVDIAQLARDVLALADAMQLDQFDLWGTHTGASVALEAAVIAPDRVGRAILEGPPLLPSAVASNYLEHYFQPLTPHPWGLHLLQAWNMRRDMFLFWPWYRAEHAAARPLGVPDASFLHDWTIGLLQSGVTYSRSYRAAFEYDTRARLPLLRCPALICASQADMLVGSLAAARAMELPQVTVTETPATVWYPKQSPHALAETIRIYQQFLGAPQ